MGFSVLANSRESDAKGRQSKSGSFLTFLEWLHERMYGTPLPVPTQDCTPWRLCTNLDCPVGALRL